MLTPIFSRTSCRPESGWLFTTTWVRVSHIGRLQGRVWWESTRARLGESVKLLDGLLRLTEVYDAFQENTDASLFGDYIELGRRILDCNAHFLGSRNVNIVTHTLAQASRLYESPHCWTEPPIFMNTFSTFVVGWKWVELACELLVLDSEYHPRLIFLLGWDTCWVLHLYPFWRTCTNRSISLSIR